MSARLMALLTALGLAVQTFAVVSVTNVTCRQRYPWNGLVDIDYTVVSDDPNADVYVMAFGVDRITGENVNLRTLSGDGADAAVKPGRHRLTWNAKVDVPTFHSDDFVVHLTPFTGAAPYLVVDLSNGENGGDLPFRYSTRPPDLSDDACRTTEMWFRLIPPGKFMMGSKPDEIGYDEKREFLHEVTLTDPFYMAIFECTQRQCELITGTNMADSAVYWYDGPMRPVYASTYNNLRGTSLGALWPKTDAVDADSFMGIFRSRTLLKADLPTSAQWEYACRAGTDTSLNNGHDITDADTCPYANEVAHYKGTVHSGRGGYIKDTTKVGLYRPNNWGLYDMHGNISEWCRDWQARSDTTSVTNPVGIIEPPSDGFRIFRGGNFSSVTTRIRSGRWEGVTPDSIYAAHNNSRVWIGFRPIIVLHGSEQK